MGRSQKVKGGRVERELVRLHEEAGLPAVKVPLSGAVKEEGFDCDLLVAKNFKAEVKARKGGAGFKVLEKWLGHNDLLFLKRDYASPLVAMPWEVYVKLLRAFRLQSVQPLE